MSKYEMIDRIRRVNRTVNETFLLEFDEPQLESYLQRLTRLQDQRGSNTGWVRSGETMAVVTRRRRAA